MAFSVRLCNSLVGFAGLLLAGTAISAFASDTNVFLLKNALKADAQLATGVEAIKFKTNPELLLGTNVARGVLAVAVDRLECRSDGLRPAFRMVVFNTGTQKIVTTLVDFEGETFLFNGSKSAALRARGRGREGVNAADLETYINFSYEECVSLNTPTVLRSIQIQPIGFLQPAGISGGNGPFLLEGGQLQILSEGSEMLLPISGIGELPIANCDIDLNPASLDFGGVGVGTNETQSFQIRNNGSSSCTVTAIVRNGSSDFTVSSPGLPLTLAKGEFVNVDITYTPSAAGTNSAVVRVSSTDPANPQLFLNVTGHGQVGVVDCSVVVNPLSLNFGTVEIGTNHVLNVTLSNNSAATCSVDAVTLVSSTMEFSVTSPVTPFQIPPSTSQVVAVQYQPTDSTLDTATLEISTAGFTQLSLVSLTGSGTVARCSLSITPTTLDFGAVAVGTNRDLSVTISNTGLANCSVSSATLTGSLDFAIVPVPTIPFAVPAGTVTNLHVVYTPSGGGNATGTLRIVSDDPDGAVNVPVSGFGVSPSPECDINVSQSALAFGTVNLGKTNTLTLVISNTGQSNCTVNALNLSGSTDFHVVAPATPFPVNANAAVQIAVRYIPTGNGPDAGNIQIVSDDPLEPFINVTLSGTGFQCNLNVSTNALAFGSIPVGDTNTLSVVLSNTNAVNCTVDAIHLSGSSDFRLDPFVPTSAFTLAPNDSVEIPVIYIPSNDGADSGTLQIESSDAGGEIDVALTGTGLQSHLMVTPSSLAFGTVTVGATNTIILTITNTGNTNTVVDSLQVLNNGNLQLNAPATSINLAPGASVEVEVNFIPASVQTIIINGGKLKSSGKPVVVTP